MAGLPGSHGGEESGGGAGFGAPLTRDAIPAGRERASEGRPRAGGAASEPDVAAEVSGKLVGWHRADHCQWWGGGANNNHPGLESAPLVFKCSNLNEDKTCFST